jgi:YidC/Oxa1 family membrane protein insertase
MNVFFVLIANLLALIYAAIPNYAIAIIGLTLAIMIVMTPLTLKGTRSMMVMQQLQPEMKKIQTRYKDDRPKLNEELLKFYKENDISPLGGCLPLLVQMPIFLVLYQVLRGLTRRISGMGYDTGWVTGQLGSGTGATKAPSIDRSFDSAFLDHKSKMYVDLSHTNTMQAFGMDLAESAKTALSHGFLHAIPYLLLIVIVGITGFIQQKQIQGRNPNQQTNPQQQMIMKVMPIFLPVISFGLPAGLVLYFAVSNLYRVGQQWFISRSLYGPNGPGGSSGPAAATSSSSNAPSNSAASDAPEVPPSLLATIRGALPGRFAPDANAGADTAAPKKSSAKPSAKSSSRASAKTPVKSSVKAPAKTNGRTTPAKRVPKTKKTTGSVSGSSAPSTSSSSTPSASPKGDAAGSGSTPTMQPRARKNKKE